MFDSVFGGAGLLGAEILVENCDLSGLSNNALLADTLRGPEIKLFVPSGARTITLYLASAADLDNDEFLFYPDDHVFVGSAFSDATIQVLATDGCGNETWLERRGVETEGYALPSEQKDYAKSGNAELTPLAGP